MARAPMDAELRFAANLSSARKALRLTQSQLARRMRDRHFGWHGHTAATAELGKRQLRLREAEALAAIVCVPLDRMLTETPERVAKIARQNAGVVR
ncbi:hypothetical protein [Nocardia wallacei]|uniref:hypothetical protein n=1 Tax=Nocardia wallacei TaxID=480035 RepID=UPI002453B6AB|nr:hypothetical protein [Nocardia wallacei]